MPRYHRGSQRKIPIEITSRCKVTKSCLPISRSLTSDHEILATVSGLPNELDGEILLESRTHNCSQAQQEIIDTEIQKLRKKKVIVKCGHEEWEIISS